MLLNLREYYRPTPEDGGVARALELLARSGIRTVPLAGGDTLLASADPMVEAVVDLQGLGLDFITAEGHPGGCLHIGAMVTRAALTAACRGEIPTAVRTASSTSGETPPTLGEASPTLGEASPTSGEVSPTSGEASPTWGTASPTWGMASPTWGEVSPTWGEASPTLGEVSPTSGMVSPTLGKAPPIWGEASPTLGGTSPLFQIVAEGARRWGGSVQRNRATVGGALAVAAPDDPLLVALLACDASVVLYSQGGTRFVPLRDFLPERGRLLATPALITELVIPRWGDSTGAALEIVSRTPADAPIVAVAAMLAFAGDRVAHARLALAGVAGTVVRLPEIEAMLADQALTPDLIASAAARVPELLHPAGDFRGSAEYRRAMAGVLTQRALKAIVTR